MSTKKRSYDDDLCWRIVYQSVINGKSVKDISDNLFLSQSTVYRILNRFERTGNVSPDLPTPKSRCLHDHDIFIIVQLLSERPSCYLREIQHELLQITGTIASMATICRDLKRLGFTRKKVKYIALQRCKIMRAEYQCHVSMYNSSSFVFIDESGSDIKDCRRRYGYALQGYPAKSVNFMNRGKRYSAIGIITTTSFLDCYIVEGSVNGDIFYHFVQSALLPHLIPFNGSNPNSIVILDNCSIHHIKDTIDLIHSVGALVFFLPPYSPDLMPIEECFNKVKIFLKEHESIVECTYAINFKTLMLAAFATITPEDCQAFAKDCGY